jgi:tetratricopeptide (TPR) repeat protein
VPLDLVALVTGALGAVDPGVLRELVDTTPDLMSDDVVAALLVVAEQAGAEGEHALGGHAANLAALLRRCRLVGPEESFAEAAGGGCGVEEAWLAAIEARGAGDVDATERGWRRLLALLPASARRPVPLARLDALSALGALLLERHADGGGEAVLDEVVALFEAAAAEACHGGAADHLANLAAALMARHDERGDPADVDLAVAAFQGALADPGCSPGCRSGARSGLGSALLVRHGHTGDRRDLDDAIRYLEAATDVDAADDADGAYLSNLGQGLCARYEADGTSEDLRRSAEVLRAATTALPAGSPAWSGATANLAFALLLSYFTDGDPAVLNEAVALAGTAVEHGAAVDLPGYRNTLSACLDARFERTGELDQLDAAVAAVQRAVDDSPAAAPERSIYLDGLAGSLRDRYVWRGEVGDIRAAVAVAEEAVAATGPTDTERPRRLATLANCLATDPSSAGPATVERVVACCREALDRCPAESPELWLHTFHLAVALLDRHEDTGSPGDLDAAVDGFQAALARAPADLPQAAVVHYDLAVALTLREAAGGDDGDDADTGFETAARLGLERQPDVAVLAGRELGLRRMHAGRWRAAADSYGSAVAATLRMARSQPGRADIEVRLREAGRLAADAAFSAARADRHAGAVAVLDEGRALMLAIVLERERADLARLRNDGNGRLADRYQRAATRVSRLELGSTGPRPFGHTSMWRSSSGRGG